MSTKLQLPVPVYVHLIKSNNYWLASNLSNLLLDVLTVTLLT